MAQPELQSAWSLNGSLELDQDTKLTWSTLIPSVGFVALVCLASLVLLSVYSITAASKPAIYCLFSNYLLAPIRTRYNAWAFLFNGPDMIHDGFKQSNGGPFEVPCPDRRQVFVSSATHVAEIDAASSPNGPLSLYAASAQALQPRYTINRLGLVDRPPEGPGFIRALRTLLTNSLAGLIPELDAKTREQFEKLHPVAGGLLKDPLSASKSLREKHSPVYQLSLDLLVHITGRVIFGSELAENETFLDAAHRYAEELTVSAEIVRLSPKWLEPLVGGLVRRRNAAQTAVFQTLLPIASQRIREKELAAQGHEVPKHRDCLQWILESSSSKAPRTAFGLVHEVMSIWYAAVHPTAITLAFAIQDLCLHPEYVQPLRDEFSSQYSRFEQTAQGLPLLDSFIKESTRLTPVESLSTRREAIRPFSFSDGTTLRRGDWTVTPPAAVNRSPKYYPSPEQFSGFRFAPQEVVDALVGEKEKSAPRQPTPSRLTDVEPGFMVFGTGRHLCPGRFYASVVCKVVLSYILANYDARLTDPEAPRWWSWRSVRVPSGKSVAVFTPRA